MSLALNFRSCCSAASYDEVRSGGSGAKKPGVSAAADGRGQRSIASFFGGKDQSGTAGKALPGGGQRSISSFFGAKGKAAAVGGGGGGGKSEKEPLESAAAAAADSPVPTQTAKGAVENGDGAVASAGKEDTRAEEAVAEEAWGEEMADAEAVGGREGGGGSAGGGAGEAVTGRAGARRLKRLRKRKNRGKGAGAGGAGGGGAGDGLVALAAKLVQYDPVAAATWKSGERCPSSTSPRRLTVRWFGLWAVRGGLCVVGCAWWAVRGGLCVVGCAWWAVRGGLCVVAVGTRLAAIVYLAANRVAPPHEGVELGIAMRPSSALWLRRPGGRRRWLSRST
ncbi:unnamed protein product, partial [Closterium sp. NIES-64]